MNEISVIFTRQTALLARVRETERANGCLVCDALPLELSHPQGQLQLATCLWFAQVELAEVAMELSLVGAQPTHQVQRRAGEELIDVLHFVVEAMILVRDADLPSSATPVGGELPATLDNVLRVYMLRSPVSAHMIDDYPGESERVLFLSTRRKQVADLCLDLAMLGTMLRNKPWKKTWSGAEGLDTRLATMLANVFKHVVYLLFDIGWTPTHIHDAYCQKNDVNQTRQEQGY